MTYHDNVVRFKLEQFRLAKDTDGHYGSFVMNEHCITEGQDPDSRVKDEKYFLNENGELSFSFGRHGSKEVANWWKSKIPANHTTFNHDPDDLNFAATGDLILNLDFGKTKEGNPIIKTVTINGVAIAQGHAGASNNWWFGGYGFVNVMNNKVKGKSDKRIFVINALRGDNAVNEIELTLSFSSWMALLPENTVLSGISIPGTHDSGTSEFVTTSFFGVAHCQNFNIARQLLDGIRFFDLRFDNEMHLSHTFRCKESLDTVIRDFRAFLSTDNDSEKSSEFIIALIGSDVNGGDWTDNMKDTLDQAIKDNSDLFLCEFDLTKITVKEARGHVLLLKRQADPNGVMLQFKDNTTFNYNDFIVEDEYKESETKRKLDRVTFNLDLTKYIQEKAFCITFNSVASHVGSIHTPYQYAWGGTSSVDPVMNPSLLKYLIEHKGKHNWGTIMLDFYNNEGNDPLLVYYIIASNFDLEKFM